MAKQVTPKIILWAAGVWMALSVIGLAGISMYEHTQGQAAKAPAAWPHNLSLPRGSQYTLVMSIHPQCPCTRATLQELAIAITRCPTLHTDLLFIKPRGAHDYWVKSDLWATAASFPRTQLFTDDDGKMSSILGARTSGHAFLYDPSGRLVYSGGITESRGHAGDNAGLSAIVSLANNAKRSDQNLGTAKVFGCSLFASASSRNN